MHGADEDEDLLMAMALSLGQQPPPAATAVPVQSFAAFDGDGAFGGGDGERLIRRVIPADNSCLFCALAHAFEGSAGRRERADGLRKVVAECVLADPHEYNEATLDRPPDEYAAWIQQPDNWGGGIEIAILSGHFGAELAAFDVQTQRVDIFGQGKGARHALARSRSSQRDTHLPRPRLALAPLPRPTIDPCHCYTGSVADGARQVRPLPSGVVEAGRLERGIAPPLRGGKVRPLMC